MIDRETKPLKDAPPPVSAQGGLLSKTLAGFDTLFSRPRRPAATEEEPVATTIGGEGKHPDPHATSGRKPLFGR